MKAIVIGASGGIGGAMADVLEQRGMTVLRLSRRSVPPIDLDDEASIASAAAAVGDQGPFDLVLIATGLLHSEGVAPEKTLRAIAGATLDRYFRINATGPALIIRHFLPLLRCDGRAVMAALSARVGSIGDNRLGGWVGYRASKAALNQIIRTISVELARTRPATILVGLHPGTVDTPLSKPFQRNVDPDKLFSPARSAEALMNVIDRLSPSDSGHVFDWKGDRIPA